MTSLNNRKIEYLIYWLGMADELDNSRVERLKNNQIAVHAFTDEDDLRKKIAQTCPDLLVIANYADIATNMEIGLGIKAEPDRETINLMLVTELLDKQTKEYFYQSGGSELVLEPASLLEIFFRIRHSKYVFDQQHNSNIQVREASQMAMLAMENASDLGGTINFVKSAVRCNSYQGLARCILDAVSKYSDSAVVEMTGIEEMHYYGSNNQVDPDLKKLLLSNKGETRIVRFDNAYQMNHEHMVLLAEGLPVHDLERMGRIADSLVILTDTANRFVSEILLREQSIVSELAKKRFISTMSHELNTPMNAIQGFAKMFASRGEEEAIGKKGVTALNSIYQNSEKMKHIIATLIEITTEDLDAAPLSNDLIDVNGLILQLKNICAPLAEKKELTVSFPESIDLQFRGDHKNILKMLTNLLDNAIKFTEIGEVELSILQMASPSIGDSIEFTVRDTGIGISKKDQLRLFNQLGQLNIGHDRTKYGAGLGLYYVHNFAKQLKGKIEVKSELNKGSQFILTLPTNITKAIEDTELF